MNDTPLRRCPDAAWYAESKDAALAAFAVSSHGLTASEAASRLHREGRNRLPEPPRQGPLARFARQFNNVLIYVLLAAAVVTAGLGHLVDTAVIVGVVVINAVVGFLQEGKAERALDAIRQMLSPTATVIRDGSRQVVPAEEIAPGDLVFVQSGDRVPADLRLIAAKGLQIQEAALTGESVPVDKGTDAVVADAALGDRSGMAYSGTLVTYGQGTGVAVATGAATEIGRISAMLGRVQTLETPLLRQMAAFARWLTVAILALAAFTSAFGILVRGYGAAEMFIAAVGLAVAAIPEGLPAVVTITLAIGVQRMARRNAIVRRLPAVETLGSVTVICSDKTGTLTRNEMTVQRLATGDGLFEVTGAGYGPDGVVLCDGCEIDDAARARLHPLATTAALCVEARLVERSGVWTVDGDPTEGALLAAATKLGVDAREEASRAPRRNVVPFESEHRFMATLHDDPERPGGAVLYVKGAPERLLAMCRCQRANGEEVPLDAGYWRTLMDEIAGRGQRVMALAMRRYDSFPGDLNHADVGELTLLGLAGISDPAREEARDAIARCMQAGIRIKMITGDHGATARAIARHLGLLHTDTVLTGPELDALDVDGLARAAPETSVFARTSPEHKLRLVEALQAGGEVVVMTGDGVNDAPALKRADVGVAMGMKGTDAAKEAAEMVLADDNFRTIADAVEEGRTVYDNLKKAILFILPTNGGEALVVLAAILLGWTLPITPVQILWVNMVSAVTLGLALAFEPPEHNVMSRPPRAPDEPLLSPYLIWRIVAVAALLAVGTFWLFERAVADGEDVDFARTVAVNTLVVAEIFYLFSTRYLRASVLNPEGFFGSRAVLVAVAAVSAIQLLYTYAPPLQALFASRPLPLEAWPPILAVGVGVLLLAEADKAIAQGLRRRKDEPS